MKSQASLAKVKIIIVCLPHAHFCFKERFLFLISNFPASCVQVIKKHLIFSKTASIDDMIKVHIKCNATQPKWTLSQFIKLDIINAIQKNLYLTFFPPFKKLKWTNTLGVDKYFARIVFNLWFHVPSFYSACHVKIFLFQKSPKILTTITKKRALINSCCFCFLGFFAEL